MPIPGYSGTAKSSAAASVGPGYWGSRGMWGDVAHYGTTIGSGLLSVYGAKKANQASSA